MPRIDYKWALILLLLATPTLYYTLTKNKNAPTGKWVNQDIGDCKEKARISFGTDIIMSEGSKTFTFATNAIYTAPSNDSLVMDFFQRSPNSPNPLNLKLSYERTGDRLVPKKMSINKGPALEKIPSNALETYTFKRCSD